MYLEYPLVLVQQSVLFYYVLKFKHLLDTEIVLLSMLIYLTMILFMADILPKTILDYLIVNVSEIWNMKYFRLLKAIFSAYKMNRLHAQHSAV